MPTVEFKKIPPESGYYAVAMHEAGVALYRAGRFEAAIRAGVQAMERQSGRRAAALHHVPGGQ